MNSLLTNNPVALQALMSETIFTGGDKAQVAEPSKADTTSGASAGSATQAAAATVPTEEFVYQGDRRMGVLFILRYPDYPYFSPQAEEAFVKMIGALRLTPDKVAVVNLANAHNPNDFARIMAFFEPTKIILLGVEPASLKLPAIAHNSFMKGRKATVFNTFSFEEMFADEGKKRAFWTIFKSFMST